MKNLLESLSVCYNIVLTSLGEYCFTVHQSKWSNSFLNPTLLKTNYLSNFPLFCQFYYEINTTCGVVYFLINFLIFWFNYYWGSILLNAYNYLNRTFKLSYSNQDLSSEVLLYF